jgi:hypothetical protein
VHKPYGRSTALGAGSAALTPEERVAILDGQAQYLAASARAGLGELAAADTALADAQAKLARRESWKRSAKNVINRRTFTRPHVSASCHFVPRIAMDCH